MSFPTESTSNRKTVLSDVQEAWQVLRDPVIACPEMEGWNRAVFHSFESEVWWRTLHL